MHISEQGLSLIRRFEGFSAERYYCPAGKPTIGYGHVIRDGERYSVLTETQANNLLIQDVAKSEQAVRRLVTIELSQNQFDALVSFVFNVGVEAFEKSCLLKVLNANNPQAAASEFNRWVFASGRRLAGLVRRRAEEAALFRA